MYTQKTAEHMAKVGLAVKDKNGTYWAYGAEIKIVNDIYNEVESRICGNCKYLNGRDKTSKCLYGYLPSNLYEFEFGCTKFKWKDDR